MKQISLLFLLLVVAACSGGDDDADKDVPAQMDVVVGDLEADLTPVATKEWHLVEGAELDGFSKVRGFGCNDDWLYINVEGAGTKGLYAWDFDEEPALNQVFAGVGVTRVLSSGALVASYTPNGTSAIVGVDTEGTATDMGFAFETMEVRNLSYPGSHLVTFSKDWTTAYYLVHRAKLPDGPFEQVGPHFTETGMGLYASPSSIYVLTVMNEVLGTACYQAPLTSGAEASWSPCPVFPDFAQDKPSEPYSVNAQIYGNGERLGIWFRVSDKGEQSARHYVASDKIKWTEVSGMPEVEPTAWFHDGESIYVGLSKSGGKAAVWSAAWDGESPAEALGEGLPATADKVGIAGLCRAGNQLYAAWYEYNPGGSTVQLYRRAR
jgi:hypothetical protein